MDAKLKKHIKENYKNPNKQKKSWFSFLGFGKKDVAKNKVDCCKECCCIYDEIDFEKNMQETFVQYLFKIIDAKGVKDSEVYKKANIDRKLFSKIRSNVNYLPSKNTLLALAIGLELNLDETKSFLEKAGFALSKSILTDVIVEYYIINKQYNIFKINQTICDYKLQPLGSNA